MYLATTVVSVLCLGLFVYHFLALRSKSIMSFHKICSAMPMYKKRYFQAMMDRLKYTKSLMLCWVTFYGFWTLIDCTSHVCDVLDIYSNRVEFHYARCWLDGFVCDSLLCLVILCYLKPRGISGQYANILMKYGRPINNKRRVSLQHIY